MSGYFLPYQADWLRDTSRLKIWEKSRRIGATYAQAYEDVVDASAQQGAMDVWFTSADESAAKEYIRYCAMWSEVLSVGAEDLGEIVLDGPGAIKALAIQFASGKRIHGLSSNPTAFRSKGGKLVIDEFAFHPRPDDLWKAAGPVVTWGYPVRILSTYNGKGNRYYRMVDEARKGNSWSLHTTTIEDAVAAGLAARVRGQETATPEDMAAFLAECRDLAGDWETYLQEYMCQPVDEATAWLTWDLITAVESPDAGFPDGYEGGDAYVGMDIGRKRDLTVIWVVERVGDVLWTREVVSMKGMTFAAQDAALDQVMASYNVRRCCMDATGLGLKPVEDAQKRHGSSRIEGVTFTAAVKQHLAGLVKEAFEDRKVRIPADRAIRDAHHAVRKLTTAAGNPRFDADRTEVGHADQFWAHGLALHAAYDGTPAPAGASRDVEPDTYRADRSSRTGLLTRPAWSTRRTTTWRA